MTDDDQVSFASQESRWTSPYFIASSDESFSFGNWTDWASQPDQRFLISISILPSDFYGVANAHGQCPQSTIGLHHTVSCSIGECKIAQSH